MEKAPLLMLLYFANVVLLSNILVNSYGLKIALIHSNSQESPLFQHNLSHEERIQRFVYQSKVRGKSLTNKVSAIVQPQVEMQSFLYIVKLGIGTFKSNPPYIEYYFEIDTGSELIWTQCDGCTKCFSQTPKPFPKQNSSSFHPIMNGETASTYESGYEDGASTRGILATETFYIKSNTGAIIKIGNLQFGCGLNNNKMQYGTFKNNKVSGMMGLAWGDLSFVNQINMQSNGKFSYCLPPISKKMPKAYLIFGDSIKTSKNAKTTPLYKVNGKSAYYVGFQGISINQKRLNINPKVFELKNNGRSGGCAIDSGTTYTAIISPAFEILKSEMEKHLSGFKKMKGSLGFELCYERNKPDKLPEVTFHFQGSGADFVMKAEAVFEVVVNRSLLRKVREYFCLAMLRTNLQSIIGSYQQINQRVIYDTKNKKLVFYGDDCSRNP